MNNIHFLAIEIIYFANINVSVVITILIAILNKARENQRFNQEWIIQRQMIIFGTEDTKRRHTKQSKYNTENENDEQYGPHQNQE